MNNLNTDPPAYSAVDIPDCDGKEESTCIQTQGCQMYRDECVPKVQETLANLYEGRAGEVQRTLSAVTGSDCAPHFREMYEREFDSIDDRQNRDRTMAAVLAYNMRDGDTDWTDTSSPGVESFLHNPGCVICTNASEAPFGRMKCCGAPIHEHCFVRWFSGKPPGAQRCVVCRRLPEAPHVFGAANPQQAAPANLPQAAPANPPQAAPANLDHPPEFGPDPSLLPWRRMDDRSRPTEHMRRLGFNPGPPPNPVQHADITINATNGGCPIGRLTGGNLCAVDAELAKKIHIVVYNGDGGITSPQARQIHDLVQPIFGQFIAPSSVDLNMDINDDRIVEREARANRTRAHITYVFTDVFPNIDFQIPTGGLTGYATLDTAHAVPLGVLNGKLRSTRLTSMFLRPGGGIQGNVGDVEELCRILNGTPLLSLTIRNFNLMIEPGLEVLRNDHNWSRDRWRTSAHKISLSYIDTTLRVEDNKLEFIREDIRPRGMGAPAGYWRRYWERNPPL